MEESLEKLWLAFNKTLPSSYIFFCVGEEKPHTPIQPLQMRFLRIDLNILFLKMFE